MPLRRRPLPAVRRPVYSCMSVQQISPSPMRVRVALSLATYLASSLAGDAYGSADVPARNCFLEVGAVSGNDHCQSPAGSRLSVRLPPAPDLLVEVELSRGDVSKVEGCGTGRGMAAGTSCTRCGGKHGVHSSAPTGTSGPEDARIHTLTPSNAESGPSCRPLCLCRPPLAS